ncbi:GGDEF domain-containing protein [Stenotrophomonas koreensis]|uniref:GGDEF domain-containing protein n=1 Tax=Stenotrophomonas koreensis TaxID=266128 RepID=UPI00339129E8
MPATSPVVLDDAAIPLAHAWRQVLLETPAPALELLSGLATDAPPELAVQFYAALMEDPRASRFLDHDQVRNRLQPAMQRWLVQVLCARAGQVEQLISLQGVIGDVHARVGIPVDLVGRGMRVLLVSLVKLLYARSQDRQIAHAASMCLLHSICIAQEGMTQAYTRAKDRSARADAAYRLFSLVQNVSAERERQRALLLDWENQLLYALASPDSLATIEPLAASEFGLWFIHKGIPSFGQNSETEHLSSLITQTDQLLAQLQAGGVAQTANLMPAIRQQLEKIRSLQTMLFERIGELDSGSDPLTNLLNRRFLPTVLRREIELTTSNGTRFAVLLIDLDHFKAINDQHGHETGDRALQHVAATLSQHTRGSDYLFRYGGEEFVVVLVGVTTLQAMVIAENLRKLVSSNPLSLPTGGELALTASIGVAAFDGHPDYQRLMARADAAMYQAKNGGRDQVQLAP